jgi:hypothetical protein
MTARSKQRTLVRNEMLRGTEPLSRVSNKSRYLHRRRLRMENLDRERHSRKHVQDNDKLESEESEKPSELGNVRHPYMVGIPGS